MAIRYASLELDNTRLFGVRLSGTVSRDDKQNLLALADRCLEHGKLHLVLDLSELGAIGGGGARVLADLQFTLAARGGEAVFVGAGPVVRRFLRQRFDGLPLRFFPSLEMARERCLDPDFAWDPDGDEPATAHAVDERDRHGNAPGIGDDMVGAIAAVDDDELAELPDSGEPAGADESALVDETFVEARPVSDAAPVPAPATGAGGRRKDHHYLSLAEAAAQLGRWKPGEDDGEFAAALRNLLFSHGLAEDALLLTGHGETLRDAQGQYVLPFDGTLASQLQAAEGPLTMLDLADGDLLPEESELLEQFTPDLLLPVRADDRLVAVLLLVRGEQEREYTVAEHFALELLMRLLADAVTEAPVAPAAPEDSSANDLPAGVSEFSHTGCAWTPADGHADALPEALMQLALNLPEATDLTQFWRLLARHAWPVLPLCRVGFLAAGVARPQLVAGAAPSWERLDMGEDRLRHFLRMMEMPVRTANLPNFFKQTREDLLAGGVEWIVGMRWQDEYLGTALLGLEPSFSAHDVPALLSDLFAEAARLLHRLDTGSATADLDLEIVRVLVEQHEKRSLGPFALTGTMVSHLHRLSRVMGLTVEQERELVRGCLLRDVGLLAREEALWGPRGAMDPTQWPRFRQHPTEGASLLRAVNAPQAVIDVVAGHHERFNGRGFPLGLREQQIPLFARIVKVVEHYVSLVTGDALRAPVSAEQAVATLLADGGERFDPDVVAVFVKALPASRRPTASPAAVPVGVPVGVPVA
jgi:anti-anti-sigma regulatory factor